MSVTNNYKLYIEDSASTAFQYWREQMASATNSNMTKIDKALDQKADKPVSFSVSLTATGWSGNTQIVSDTRFVSSGYLYIVTADPGNFTDYAKAVIYADNVTSNGRMAFHCGKTPSTNLTVTVVRMVEA